MDGSTDPIHDSMLFSDDELFIGYMEGGTHGDDDNVVESLAIKAPTSGDCTSWTDQVSRNWTTDSIDDPPDAAAASGRIADPARDQAVVVLPYYDFYPAKTLIQLNDLRPGHDTPVKEALIRVPEPDDCMDEGFVDVAVGDLDRVIGEDHFYHDEIVVVQSAVCTNDDKAVGPAVMVDVLDHRLNVIASYDFAGSYRNVAVALGDFNGDHLKEIVIAMVQPDTVGDTSAVVAGRLNVQAEEGQATK